METVNICHCNNCYAEFIDTNPQRDAKEYNSSDFPGASELVVMRDGEGYIMHACPNCLTDSYLVDDAKN